MQPEALSDEVGPLDGLVREPKPARADAKRNRIAADLDHRVLRRVQAVRGGVGPQQRSPGRPQLGLDRAPAQHPPYCAQKLCAGRCSILRQCCETRRDCRHGPRYTGLAMPVVQLNNIRKVYGDKVAVDDLSLAIDPGTMFGLLGPNGSGKTSTIRMMIGMTVPDAGTVELFGQPFDRAALSKVGYLPEERGLYKKMQVLEQLIFLGRLHGLAEATARERALLWCERMQISEAIGKKTEELSKGMQQKIQFIAALLHEPELIIMDEPFSGLDPVNATLLQDTLVDLRREGKAILFSTHRMDQVEKLCDAIAIIYQGQLVLSGTVREVKSRYPRNRVQMVFQGSDRFLGHPGVLEAKNFAGIAEITLQGPEFAQALLAEAVNAGVQITRFEVVEPTLEEIFIETVKGTPAYAAAGGLVHA